MNTDRADRKVVLSTACLLGWILPGSMITAHIAPNSAVQAGTILACVFVTVATLWFGSSTRAVMSSDDGALVMVSGLLVLAYGAVADMTFGQRLFMIAIGLSMFVSGLINVHHYVTVTHQTSVNWRQLLRFPVQ